jgi:hypothetical protein
MSRGTHAGFHIQETVMKTQQNIAVAQPEVRALGIDEVESVAGGALNCFPIFGEDGKMYSPTLDGYPGGPLRDLWGFFKIPVRPL